LGLWLLSLFVFSVFRTPHWLTWSGAAFLILYAAWSWPFLKAAFLLLLAAWLHSSLTLAPSGLYWLSLFILYIVVYVAQFRFMIRNAWQFLLVVALVTWAFEFLQLIIVSQLYPGHTVNWGLIFTLFLAGLTHALVAMMIYPSVQRWVVD
jgi:hypothetical protein